MQLKSTYLSDSRLFVLKICKTIQTGIWSSITIRVPKKKYLILFGIEKIRMPNTNTTIRSNYPNSTELFVTRW